MAFQVGEALQALSGGILQATPHCVVAADTSAVSKCRDMARCTFALFMQPHWDQCLDGPHPGDQDQSIITNTVEHWSPGITFGEFSKAKFKTYYKS